jgi:hypothetical protein
MNTKNNRNIASGDLKRAEHFWATFDKIDRNERIHFSEPRREEARRIGRSPALSEDGSKNPPTLYCSAHFADDGNVTSWASLLVTPNQELHSGYASWPTPHNFRIIAALRLLAACEPFQSVHCICNFFDIVRAFKEGGSPKAAELHKEDFALWKRLVSLSESRNAVWTFSHPSRDAALNFINQISKEESLRAIRAASLEICKKPII